MMPSSPSPDSTSENTTSVGQASVSSTSAGTLEGPQWLHPLSLLFEFVAGVRTQLIPAIFAVYSAAQWGKIGLFFALCFLALTMGFAILRYVTIRFQIRGNDLIVDEGLIFRRHRTIPIDRIQNVDLYQNIFHRPFRVAEVRIETAAGTKPEAKLRVLSLKQFELLRAKIFDKSRGVSPQLENESERQIKLAPAEAAEVSAEPRLVLKLPTHLLIKAGLLSNRGMVIVAVVFGGTIQFTSWGDDWFFNPFRLLRRVPWNWLEQQWIWAIAATVVLLILLRLFSAVWYVLRFHGYRLESRGEEFRIQCGLFSRISATVPRRRIQLISIQRTILGKKLGIAAIRIETAGGTSSESEEAAETISRRWFVPVLCESDVARIIEELRPGLQWNEFNLEWQPPAPRAAARMRRLATLIALGITGLALWYFSWLGLVLGFLTGLLAIWYAGKKAAAMRYARLPAAIVYRSGLITKRCSVTFFEKVQSVWVDHSPFDRRWKMANLCIDTAGAGPAEHKLHVQMLDEKFAHIECREIARAASAHGIAIS